MKDIKITEEHMNVINTVFTYDEKKELLNKIERAKLLSEFNKDKSELIRKLAENEDISDIEELTSTGRIINPISYRYKNRIIRILIDSIDNIEIFRFTGDDKGCISYRYRANSMKEVIEKIDHIHNAIDIGII